MISIITCSISADNQAALRASAASAFPPDTEIIIIQDATSLCEGFNRGLDQATGDIIVLCHDDIEFLSPNMGDTLERDLTNADIVGVAGTSYLQEGNWISAGYPHSHGHVMHVMPENAFGYCIYGIGCDPQFVTGIQALDGLFIAGRHDTLSTLRYDQDTFDGWHLYDLDFTYSAYQKGLRLAVDYDIHILHNSGGNYDDKWDFYKRRFDDKYRDVLPSTWSPSLTHYSQTVIHGRQLVVPTMERHATFKRLSLHTPSPREGFESLTDTSSTTDGGVQAIEVNGNLDKVRDKIIAFNEWWRLLDNSGVLCLSFPESSQWTARHLGMFGINSDMGDERVSKRGYHGTFIIQALDGIITDGERWVHAILAAVKTDEQISQAREYYKRPTPPS